MQRNIAFDLRINVISLANLGALMALLFTAIGTWYGLIGRVDTLNFRVDSLSKELVNARNANELLKQANTVEDREVHIKLENFLVRLSLAEAQLGSILTTVNRMDQKLVVTIPKKNK